MKTKCAQIKSLMQQNFQPNQLQQLAECEERKWQIYRRTEVQKEARENKKVWVTHGKGVYDLTEFAKSHPGGSEKLLMAKGGPIEPFWQMYPFHKNEQIIKLLDNY